MARHDITFLRQHGFDSDGRMFFSVTKTGQPLRKRRFFFTEAFACIAMAAYSRAANDEQAALEARALFELMHTALQTPGMLSARGIAATRASKSLAVPMILLHTAQELREHLREPSLNAKIDQAISEIESDFVKPEWQAVLEYVGMQGEFYDNFDGRLICPGHSIEAAWFILAEAKKRNRAPALLELGLRMLDWSWRWGWDDEFGGVLYYRDVKNLPVAEYWHDMKFWWPHNETLIATLLAWQLSGDAKYLQWHEMTHEWAYRYFPDAEHGEWFGYLHRDGRLSTRLKGNMWKGPFHLPRMQLLCWQWLEEIRQANQSSHLTGSPT